MSDKEREIDDFQRPVQLKKTKLEPENDTQSFRDMFIIEKHLLLKYLTRFRYLKIRLKKRKQKIKIFALCKIKNRLVSMIGKS